MKKIIAFLSAALFISVTVTPVYASPGFIGPNSKLYFFQPALESIRLFFTPSEKAKVEYLIELADRRTEEMNVVPSVAASGRYAEHFAQLEKIAEKTPDKDKEQVVEKIKEASLRQQEVLAKVYAKVPDEAKDAILNAQESSSKNVANVVGSALGEKKAEEYSSQIVEIQKVEKAERAERIEQAPMEESTNDDPSKSVPKEPKPAQGLNPLNQLKSINDEQNTGDQGTDDSLEPVEPTEIQQPIQQIEQR